MSAFSPIPEETIYFTMERSAFSSSYTFNTCPIMIMIDGRQCNIGTLFNCVPAQFTVIFKVLGRFWKWLQECWMSCCGRRATLNTFGGRQMTIWEITIEQNKDVPAQIFSSNYPPWFWGRNQSDSEICKVDLTDNLPSWRSHGPIAQRSSTLLLGTHSPGKFISNQLQHTCL